MPVRLGELGRRQRPGSGQRPVEAELVAHHDEGGVQGGADLVDGPEDERFQLLHVERCLFDGCHRCSSFGRLRPNVGPLAARSPRVAPLVRGSSQPWRRPYNRRMLLGRDPERHALEPLSPTPRLNRSAVARRWSARSGSARRRCSTTPPSRRERRACASCARAGSSRRRGPVRGPARAAASRARRARPDPGAAGGRARRRARAAAGDGAGPVRGRRGDAEPARGACGGARRVAAFVDDAHWLDGSSADALLFAISQARRGSDRRRGRGARGRGVLRRRSAASDAPRSAGWTGEAAAAARRRRDAVDRLYAATGGQPARAARARAERRGSTDLPIDAPVPIVGERRAGVRPPARSRCPSATRARCSSSRPRATPVSLQSLARGVSPDVASRTSSRPSRPVSSRSRTAASSSATPRRGRRSTGPRRPRSVVPRTRARRRATGPRRRPPRVASRARRPSAPTTTASSALEQAGGRARERSAYDVAAAAFERAAALSLRAGAACSTPRPTRPGSPARRTGRSRCSTRPSLRRTTSALALAIEHLRGQIATRRGPVRGRGRSWPTPPSALPPPTRSSRSSMLAEATCSRSTPATRRRWCGCRAGDRARRAGLDGRAAHPRRPGGRHGARLRRRGRQRCAFDPHGRRAARGVRRAPRRPASRRLGRARAALAARGRGGAQPVRARARRSSAAGRRSARCPSCSSTSRATGRPPTLGRRARRATTRRSRSPARPASTSRSPFALAGLAWLEARQGREAACRAHAAEGREAASARAWRLHELWTIAALGDLELGLGRPEAASSHYRGVGRVAARRAGSRTPTSRPRRSSSRRYLRLGRDDEAAAHAARLRAERAARRASRGRSPARRAAAACSQPTTSSSGVRRGDRAARTDAGRLRDRADAPRLRRAPTPRRPARPRARASCARRSRPSTRSAPSRGRTWRASSSRRRAKPRAGAIRRRSTS